MDEANSKSLGNEDSNDFIKKRVVMNGAHMELVSISQDTDDSSITSQKDSINCDGVSIMRTAENKSTGDDDRSVVKSDSLLHVEVALKMMHSKQLD
ncbi:hypothetical protein BGZ49_002593, partial [Haplosporangium sp. Z 27]